MNFSRIRSTLSLFCFLLFPFGLNAQEDPSFKNELFERALQTAETLQLDFMNLPEFQEAAILDAPEKHPSQEWIKKIYEKDHPNEYERSREVAAYLSRCVRFGVIKGAIDQLQRRKLTDDVLSAFVEAGLACGFYRDRDSFEKILEHLRSLEGKPFMAAKAADTEATDEEDFANEDKDEYVIVARKLTPELTKLLCENLHCLYRIGQTKAGFAPNALPENMPDSRWGDIIHVHQAINLAGQGNFEKAVASAKRIEFQTLQELVLAKIVDEAQQVELVGTELKSLVESVVDFYRLSKPSNPSGQIIEDFLFVKLGEAEQGFNQVATCTEECLSFDFELTLRDVKLLELSIQTGLVKTGLELSAKIENEERKLEWLESVYNYALEKNDFRVMAAVVEQLPNKADVFGQSLTTHLLKLVQAAAEANEFATAEKYLQEISNEKFQRGAEWLIGAFRFEESDRGNLERTEVVKTFNRSLESAPKEKVSRMKWIVDYTMRAGWLNRRMSFENRAAEGKLLAFGRNQLIDAFAKVADAPGARKFVERNLGSFTPPSPSAKEILERMLELCDLEEPQTVDENSAMSRLVRLEKLANAKPSSSTQQAELIEDLFTRIVPELSQEQSDFQIEIEEAAYWFAKLGSKKGVNRMIDMIEDDRTKADLMLDCYFVFPPTEKTLAPPGIGRPAPGGGGIF